MTALIVVSNDCIDRNIIPIAHNTVPNYAEGLGDVQYKQ